MVHGGQRAGGGALEGLSVKEVGKGEWAASGREVGQHERRSGHVRKQRATDQRKDLVGEAWVWIVLEERLGPENLVERGLAVPGHERGAQPRGSATHQIVCRRAHRRIMTQEFLFTARFLPVPL